MEVAQSINNKIEVQCPVCGCVREVKRQTIICWFRGHPDAEYYGAICRKCAQDKAHEGKRGKPSWNSGLKGWWSESHTENHRKAVTGVVVTIETREKLRRASTGRRHTESTKKKMSECAKNRTLEHKQKLSLAALGRKQSEEHIEKTRKRMMGNDFAKGHHNFGYKHTRETREMMSKKRSQYYEQNPEAREKVRSQRIGSHLSEGAKGKIRASHAKPEVKKEVIQRLSNYWEGSNNPRWLGGISSEPYDFGFNEELKEKIRERDGRKCRVCGEPEGDRKLDVHHIDYDKKHSVEDNLISLCSGCHILTTVGDRDYWTLYLTTMVLENETSKTKRITVTK